MNGGRKDRLQATLQLLTLVTVQIIPDVSQSLSLFRQCVDKYTVERVIIACEV